MLNAALVETHDCGTGDSWHPQCLKMDAREKIDRSYICSIHDVTSQDSIQHSVSQERRTCKTPLSGAKWSVSTAKWCLGGNECTSNSHLSSRFTYVAKQLVLMKYDIVYIRY